ncbi:MAG: formylglycine-generating enzyme family protein [Planctomycetota bacterium]
MPSNILRFLTFVFVATTAGALVVSAPSVAVQEAAVDETQESQEASLPQGISEQQPESGQFVELTEGPFAGKFMVEYTATIPGTDVTFEMVPVPSGTFMMGSPETEEGRNEDEGPQRSVAVEPFWIGKHEVTWACYKTYMKLDKQFRKIADKEIRVVNEENGIDAVTAPSSLYDPGFTYSQGEEPEQPAASMTRYAAMQYTKWLSLLTGDFYRLPTEAQWEYACRAGTNTAYYFGDDPDDLEDHAWILDTSDEERQEVGQLEPNPWGLYDMYGNVAEWTLDAYSEDGYAVPEMRDGWTAFSEEQVYVRPAEVYPCVVRGGTFEADEPELCRSASRMPSDDPLWKNIDPCTPKSPWWFTTEPALGVGMRIVRPLSAPATRDEMEFWWDEQLESIELDVRNRIDFNGRGARGLVDPELPEAIEATGRRRR